MSVTLNVTQWNEDSRFEKDFKRLANVTPVAMATPIDAVRTAKGRL